MSRFALVALFALPWLGVAAGLGLLLVRRRRAAGAVAFALPAVGLLLVLTAVKPAFALTRAAVPACLGEPLYWAQVVGRPVAVAAVAVAVMVGRRPGGGRADAG